MYFFKFYIDLLMLYKLSLLFTCPALRLVCVSSPTKFQFGTGDIMSPSFSQFFEPELQFYRLSFHWCMAIKIWWADDMLEIKSEFCYVFIKIFELSPFIYVRFLRLILKH